MHNPQWTDTLVQLLSLALRLEVVSIKQQVSYFASHELTHLPQIERLAKP